MGKAAEKGFSLLELLIVVAIILIIATIALPNLMRSHQAANETAAVTELRTILAAEITYLSSSSGNFGNISQLVGAGLLDSRFTGQMAGYRFNIETNGTEYTAFADPVSASSGRYAYYTTPDGTIRYSTEIAMAPSGQAGNPVN